MNETGLPPPQAPCGLDRGLEQLVPPTRLYVSAVRAARAA